MRWPRWQCAEGEGPGVVGAAATVEDGSEMEMGRGVDLCNKNFYLTVVGQALDNIK